MIRILWFTVFLFVLTSCSSTRVRSDYDPRSDFRGLRTYTWIDADLSKSPYPGIQSPFVKERIHSAVDGELASRGYRRITSGTPDFRIAFQIVANKHVSGSNLESNDSGKPDDTQGKAPGYNDARISRPSGADGYVASLVASSLSVYPAARRGHGHGGHHRSRGHHFRHRHFGHYYSPYYGYRYRPYGFYGLYGRRYGHYGLGYSLSPSQPYVKSTLVLNVYDGDEDRLLWRGWATKDLPENPNPEDVRKYVRKAVRKILKEFPPETGV